MINDNYIQSTWLDTDDLMTLHTFDLNRDSPGLITSVCREFYYTHSNEIYKSMETTKVIYHCTIGTVKIRKWYSHFLLTSSCLNYLPLQEGLLRFV